MESKEKSSEILDKIQNDPDFINSKKHRFSLQKFIDQNSDQRKLRSGKTQPIPGTFKGTTDNIIAYFLCMSPDDVKKIYEDAVKKIRQKMNLDLE
jgi:hypothetical protein